MRGGLHTLIVVFGKAGRAMTPVGCRPSVRSSGSIFCHHPVQPIYVPQCNVCPWKRRTGDAAFVKGIEDGDPQIGARANAVVKVDKRIELEFETVRPERFELDRRRRSRCDIRIALRNVARIIALRDRTTATLTGLDAAETCAKRQFFTFSVIRKELGTRTRARSEVSISVERTLILRT